MTFLCGFSGLLQKRHLVTKVLMLPVLITAFFSIQSARAATSVYVFDPNLSTVTKTGGFAGVNIAFSVDGRFQLSVEGGTAVFEEVDATLTDEAGVVYLQSLDEVFNMTALEADVIDVNTIEFKGKTADGIGSDVSITLTFEDDLVRLKGGTTPPPDTADLFIYELDGVAARKYTSGTGEPNDPYQIATAKDLITLGKTPDDYDKHFILTADIDLDPNLPGRKIFDKAVIAPDINDSESYFQGTPFTGVFDGDGHTISHLTIVGDSVLGLFGYLYDDYPSVKVKNLGIVDVNVIGSGYTIGGLAGENFIGRISNSYSTGAVSGYQNVGGLVGTNGQLIFGGAITGSYSSCSVSGNDIVGGLVGDNSGTISDCYSRCSVRGGTYGSVGGLVGHQNSFGNITTCYSSGSVSGTDEWVGGLVGRSYISYTNQCFWDTETSGQAASFGGTGKTTAEMQTASTFLEAGWDFADETANGTEDIWWIDEGKSYPRLWWEPRKYGGGTGEPNDPYLIYTAGQLNAIGAEPNDWDRHFKLMSNIDLSGYLYSAALIAPDNDPCDPAFQGIPFKGSFDGNNHTISHLTIQGDGYLGLFGRLDTEVVVNSLKLADVNIVGSDYVGALVGFNYGHISMIYTTGKISGNNRVGGITGRNWGNIELSHNAASAAGNNDVGGIMAANYGSIINSYNTGEVTANMDAGGIAGENYGSITFTYSTGAVSGNSRAGGLVGYNWQDATVTSSFWDVEASGLTVSDGGIGKTTAEMQTKKTFTDAGWDFNREIVNGTEDIWTIDEGQDYPRLWWELIPLLN